MGLKYVFVAVFASAITLFALQNSEQTRLRFLFWALEGIPLATVILVSAAAGIVLVGLPLWIDRWRLRARARSLEARLASAEALLGERDRGPETGPPR